MRVLFLTVGNETVASSRVRIYSYANFLEREGIEYKIIPFTSRAKCQRVLKLQKDNIVQYIYEFFYKVYVYITVLVLAKKYDAIFIQKIIPAKTVILLLRKLNRNIIFDLDDAIYLNNDIEHVLKNAARVVTSNKYLKGFAARFNNKVHELISPVNVSERSPEPKKGVTIGWIGGMETSSYLDPLLPVFQRLKEKNKELSVEFMGPGRRAYFESFGIKVHDWSIGKEKEFLEKLGIGIMPLTDDKWARGKAGYKLLLYMSRGISCVTSPVGINNEIIKDEVNGLLANNTNEWYDKLKRLIEDNALRKKLGEEARETVKRSYSYEVAAPKFINILKNNT